MSFASFWKYFPTLLMWNISLKYAMPRFERQISSFSPRMPFCARPLSRRLPADINYMDTQQINEDFAQKLYNKSGKDKILVENIVQTIVHFRQTQQAQEETLT